MYSLVLEGDVCLRRVKDGSVSVFEKVSVVPFPVDRWSQIGRQRYWCCFIYQPWLFGVLEEMVCEGSPVQVVSVI